MTSGQKFAPLACPIPLYCPTKEQDCKRSSSFYVHAYFGLIADTIQKHSE